MRRFLAFSLTFLFALPVLAQDQNENTSADDASKATEAPAPAKKVKTRAEGRIRRGFFAEGDFGILTTFGGTNTNAPDVPLPSKGISNIQPFVGILLGYDLLHNDAYSFSVGARFAIGMSGGAGRVESGAESLDASRTQPNDYGIMQIGLAPTVSFMVAERLALAVKLDGGFAGLDADPAVAALDQNSNVLRGQGSGGFKFSPYAGAGLGVEYFTRLNDFSIGLDARFLAVLHDSLIPGVSVTVPLKYTF